MDYNKMSDEELKARLDTLGLECGRLTQITWEIDEILKRRRNSNIIQGDLLNKTTWELYSAGKESTLLISKSDPYEPEDLFKLAEWEHDHLSFKENCELSYNDGSLYLRLEMKPEDVLHCVKEWKLKIDCSKAEEIIDEKIEEYSVTKSFINLLKS